MLKFPKFLSIRLNLNVWDVQNFDPVKPVYLGGPFGVYFYVNKIKNFRTGKLTEVELIRL